MTLNTDKLQHLVDILREAVTALRKAAEAAEVAASALGDVVEIIDGEGLGGSTPPIALDN